MASLRNLIESAVTAYLDATLTVQVYPGMSAATKAAPCVICQAVSGEEESYNSGRWRILLRVTTLGMAADGETAFDDLCDSVRQLLYADGLPALIEAQTSGLTVWGTGIESRMEWGQEDDAFSETIEMQVVCAQTNFTN
jgi:hypothetical protein